MLYSPGTVVANDLPQPEAEPEAKTETPATPETPADPTKTPDAASKAQTQVLDAKGLMDVINADREQREKAARDASERETYKKRAEEAEAKVAQWEKAKKNRLLDPAGFLRKMGYTDRDLALTSEGIMYTLMPDKAPAGWVANLVKAQREQDQEDAEEREKQREAEQQKKTATERADQEKTIESNYRSYLESEAAAFKPGTYKASQTWFADDHKAYARELYDTARALAEEAVKTGVRPDINGSALATHVEKKYEDKIKRILAAYSQSPMTTQQPKPVAPKAQAPSKPEETESPAIIAKAKMSDKELIEKATKAAFGRL